VAAEREPDLQDRPEVGLRESAERTGVLPRALGQSGETPGRRHDRDGRPLCRHRVVVVAAPTEADARQLFESDPSIGGGTFSVKVQRCSVFYPGYVGTPPPSK